jgi:hypothetical protein
MLAISLVENLAEKIGKKMCEGLGGPQGSPLN